MAFQSAEGEQRPSPSSCEAWQEAYGNTTSNTSEKALCEDGSHQQLTLIGPYSEELNGMLPEGETWSGVRRLRARMHNLKRSVGCTRPSQLWVENRVGHRLQWVATEP
jgi:hypothetical protein